MATAIAPIDCNNFYASCERLFAPNLRNRPVVVLSNNDGCVIARSNEAKGLGIEMGAPWHLTKERFRKHGIIVRSSNYALYGDMSRRVTRVIATFAPAMEIYSIDEAFTTLNGIADPERHPRPIRETVLRWTGIPVSIGIAPTKTLAKVANRIAKKATGVHLLLTAEDQVNALMNLALTDLYGVAARMAKRLAAVGIATPMDLRNADPETLRRRAGVVMERMARELNGIPCHGLATHTPAAKSIMCSRSFGRPVTRREDLTQAVASYTERAAASMRRQNLACPTLSVFVTTNRFKPNEPQYAATKTVNLAVATADTTRLATAAQIALDAVWRANLSYKKAGVILTELTTASLVQADHRTTRAARR